VLHHNFIELFEATPMAKLKPKKITAGEGCAWGCAIFLISIVVISPFVFGYAIWYNITVVQPKERATSTPTVKVTKPYKVLKNRPRVNGVEEHRNIILESDDELTKDECITLIEKYRGRIGDRGMIRVDTPKEFDFCSLDRNDSEEIKLY
jgi:hypothetical protein